MIGARVGARIGARMGAWAGVGIDGVAAAAVVSISEWTSTKTAVSAWGNAGASSVPTIAGDGWVEFAVADAQSTQVMVGLSTSDPNQDYATIHYAIFANTDGSFGAWESGTSKFSLGAGTYVNGGRFRVRRVGTVVTYEKLASGTWSVLYTSLVSSSGALLIDTAHGTNPGTITNIKLYDSATQVAITWQNVIGCTVTVS